jgi:hypothetical protein
MRLGQERGDLLDVLGGGGHEALACDADQSSELGIAVAMKLLGVGEGPFDSLFSAFVDCLSPRLQAIGIDRSRASAQT